MILEYKNQLNRIEKLLKKSYHHCRMKRVRSITYKQHNLYNIPVNFLFRLGDAIITKQYGDIFAIGFDTSLVKTLRVNTIKLPMDTLLHQTKYYLNHYDNSDADTKISDSEAMSDQGYKDVCMIIDYIENNNPKPRIEIPGNLGIKDSSIFVLFTVSKSTGMLKGYNNKTGRIFTKNFEDVTYEELDSVCDVITYKTNGLANRMNILLDVPMCEKDKIDYHEEVQFTRPYKPLSS